MSEGPPELGAAIPGFGEDHPKGGPLHPVVVNPALSAFLELPAACRWDEGAQGRAGVTYPQGFVAAGVPCGIKESGREDLGLVAVMPEHRPKAASAAVFTTNAFAAAPVRVCRRQSDLGHLQAVVVNSGNANAATGPEGLVVARDMQQAAADSLELAPGAVGVASTGVIGVPLDPQRVRSGVVAVRKILGEERGEEFARAITTTDRFPKLAQLEVDMPGGTVRIGAAAKGAGMISPGMATMICVLTSDALVSPERSGSLLGPAVEASFNRITVDGEMSTNDSVFLLTNGASGVPVGPEDEPVFAAALAIVLKRLALMMVADGEGAAKVASITVTGAQTPAMAERAARAVADSLLVKTALHGEDPNWGRVLSSAGAALAGQEYPEASLTLGGVPVVSHGAGTVLDEEEAEGLRAAMRRPEVEMHLDLGRGPGEAQMFFSDIGHEYVRINADYHT